MPGGILQHLQRSHLKSQADRDDVRCGAKKSAGTGGEAYFEIRRRDGAGDRISELRNASCHSQEKGREHDAFNSHPHSGISRRKHQKPRKGYGRRPLESPHSNFTQSRPGPFRQASQRASKGLHRKGAGTQKTHDQGDKGMRREKVFCFGRTDTFLRPHTISRYSKTACDVHLQKVHP